LLKVILAMFKTRYYSSKKQAVVTKYVKMAIGQCRPITGQD